MSVSTKLTAAQDALVALQDELALESLKTPEGVRLAKSAQAASAKLPGRGVKADVTAQLGATETAARAS